MPRSPPTYTEGSADFAVASEEAILGLEKGVQLLALAFDSDRALRAFKGPVDIVISRLYQ